MSVPEFKSIKIVVVTHYFPAHGGGIERVCERLVSELATSGSSEISWFASDCDAHPAPSENVSVHPIPSWNIVEAKLGLPYPIWSISGYLKLWRAVRAADIVHLHDYIYLGSLIGFLAAKSKRIPLVITQHIGFIPYESRVARKILETLNRTIGRYCLARASEVVFVSQTVRDYFAQFVRRSTPPKIIANGLDTTLFVPATAATRQHLRSALAVQPERLLMLFVGRFVEKKGILILEKLARELEQFTWIFAGRGHIDPNSWGLSNVQVLGNVSQRRLAELYQAADLLILPSKGEGFPLVVQEAMACGAPVMVSTETAQALEGVSDVVLSVALDESSPHRRWIDAINIAITVPDKLSGMGKRSAEFAHRQWSWRMCAGQYERLFTEVIGPQKQ